MNVYALNETPLGGTATLLGSGVGGLSLTALAQSKTAIKASGAGAMALVGGGAPLVFRHASAQGGLALTGQARGYSLITPRAQGAMALTATAKPSLHLRATAAGAMPLVAFANGRIVVVHYVKADGFFALNAGVKTKISPPVFAKATSEPLKIGGRSAALLQMRAAATGAITLTGAAVSRTNERIAAASTASIGMAGRAVATVWRQINASAQGGMTLTGSVPFGPASIPSQFTAAPAQRTMMIPHYQEIRPGKLTMIGVAQKQPGGQVDIDLDHAHWLDGDTIATVDAMSLDETVGVQLVQIGGSRAKVWLSGGAAGDIAEIAVSTTTLAGRSKETAFKIRVRDY